MNGMGRNITEIAMALIGVAAVAMLVSNAGGTAKVIQAATSGFGGLLSIVTLQSQFGNGLTPNNF